MIKRIFKSIIPIIFFSSIMLIGGIYGAFNYARYQANDALDQIVDIEIVDFNYETHTTYFPNTDDGKTNEDLVNNLINGNGDDLTGLNEEKSLINTLINNRKDTNFYDDLGDNELLGSMDLWYGKDLRNYLPDETNMTFIIHFPKEEEDTLYLYTTSQTLENNKYINPVYKTTLKKSNAIYEIINVEEGKAKCEECYKNVNLYLQEIYLLSINIKTFEPSS